MLTAADLRNQNINSYTVETELSLINLNLLIINAAGQVSASIAGDTVTSFNGVDITGTPMTLDEDYYKVWQSIIVDQHKYAEMNKIIDYYQRLGYTVNRRSNDGQTLYWLISW